MLLLGSDADPYAAWCLDNAVMEFGQAVEAALHKVEGKDRKQVETKMERVLQKWLGMPQRFRAPVAGPVKER